LDVLESGVGLALAYRALVMLRALF